MSTDRTEEAIRAIQGYADAAGDLALRVAIGTPGAKIMYNGESEETGQQWQDPGFMRAIAHGIGLVTGSWVKEEFTLVLLSSVTLSAAPISAEALWVILNGIVLRKVDDASPPAGAFRWGPGATTITVAASTGHLEVRYIKSAA